MPTRSLSLHGSVRRKLKDKSGNTASAENFTLAVRSCFYYELTSNAEPMTATESESEGASVMTENCIEYSDCTGDKTFGKDQVSPVLLLLQRHCNAALVQLAWQLAAQDAVMHLEASATPSEDSSSGEATCGTATEYDSAREMDDGQATLGIQEHCLQHWNQPLKFYIELCAWECIRIFSCLTRESI